MVSELSPSQPTKVCRPTFSRELEHAIATKKWEEMNDEERAAKEQYDEWYRQDQEERERMKRESEEAARLYREQYGKMVAEAEKRATDRSFDWYVSKVNEGIGRNGNPLGLELTPEAAEEYLQIAYNGEVVRRGGIPQADGYTRAAVRSVAKWMATVPKPGLMLRGYIGVGKTTMMNAVKRMLYILTGVRMEVASAREIASLGKNDPAEYRRLANCRLLGIDDLGTEPLTVKSYGNEMSPLAELLSARYDSRLCTIITTNLSVKEEGGEEVDELRSVYGDRIYDRVKEMYNFLVYDGEQPSYRK